MKNPIHHQADQSSFTKSGRPTSRRVLFTSYACYLDNSNGAAVSSRELMQALSRHGFAVEVLCGSMFDLPQEVDPTDWLRRQGWDFEEGDDGPFSIDTSGRRSGIPAHYRLTVQGVPVTMYRGPTTRPHRPEASESQDFLFLFERLLTRFQPEIVVGYGGTQLARAVFARARRLGITTVFNLHNLSYRSLLPFADADVIRVPSRFAAAHYHATLGLNCTVLPNLVDPERVRIDPDQHQPKYVTFINPSPEKGVYAFARIADELGRRRPDIPLLVVEARGNETTLANCGLDLRAHHNVNLMALTSDPRRFWRVSRICLVPSVCEESFGRVPVEAMMNGIPVIASDRGALPETLGNSGLLLSLPEWLKPSTRALPSAEEIMPWVEAVVQLWDDAVLYEGRRQHAWAEAHRWRPDVIASQLVRFFESVGSIEFTRGLAD